jgi:excisionase family DNA binding protein
MNPNCLGILIRRKLPTASIPKPKKQTPTPINRKTVVAPAAPVWQPDGNQRGMKVKDAARYLGCSVFAIRQLIADGEITAYRLQKKTQYIDRADLDSYIERKKREQVA